MQTLERFLSGVGARVGCKMAGPREGLPTSILQTLERFLSGVGERVGCKVAGSREGLPTSIVFAPPSLPNTLFALIETSLAMHTCFNKPHRSPFLPSPVANPLTSQP